MAGSNLLISWQPGNKKRKRRRDQRPAILFDGILPKT
jgi:hypothetical protein